MSLSQPSRTIVVEPLQAPAAAPARSAPPRDEPTVAVPMPAAPADPPLPPAEK